MLQVSFAVGEPDPAVLDRIRNQLALYIGGMGAKDKNFYTSWPSATATCPRQPRSRSST